MNIPMHPEIEPAVAARLDAARRVIRLAGLRARAYFDDYTALTVEVKSSRQDVVSIADRDVEDFIRGEIARLFPLDGVFGEERGGSATDSGYVWVIDPIDGTSAFLHGLPSWCVVIALVRDGHTLCGLVHDPMRDQLFHAVVGGGAFRDGRPIRVDRETPLSGGLIAIGASRPEQSRQIGRLIEGVLAAGGVYMRNGSAALSLAHVAAGHYLGYYEPRLSSWDCLAGLLLVTEAGGEADDFLAGGDLSAKGPVFAAAPQIADIFRALTQDGACET